MIWLLIKALIAVTPAILDAIRDGRVRSATQDEILLAIFSKLEKRVEAALRAGEGNLPDEDSDPNNRARTK